MLTTTSSNCPNLLYPSSSSSKPLQKMECVHRTLDGGFGQETGAKTAAFVEDLWGFNGDDLFVDELLDFSNGFSETEELPSEEEKTEEKAKNCFNSQEKRTIEPENGFVSLPETELSVPAEGLESLEWLSHFVEDSFSDYSLAGNMPPKPEGNGSEPAVTPPAQPCFTTPVHTKARTKRARTGSRVWPVISPSSSSSSSPTSSTTTSFKPCNLLNQAEYFFLEKPVEKKVKKKSADNGSVGRRCSHCGVTKTPQWRAGPLGSKTLCNACGVRFKSGRLVPEYRPACSPTFSSELHSNNHRKVLEMRRKKEMEMEMEMEAAGVPSPVQSFCKSN